MSFDDFDDKYGRSSLFLQEIWAFWQGRVPLILEEPAAAGQGAPLPPSVFSPPLYLDLEMPARKSELGRPRTYHM